MIAYVLVLMKSRDDENMNTALSMAFTRMNLYLNNNPTTTIHFSQLSV